MDLTWVFRRPVLKAKVNQQINYNEQLIMRLPSKRKVPGINSHRGQEFFIL